MATFRVKQHDTTLPLSADTDITGATITAFIRTMGVKTEIASTVPVNVTDAVAGDFDVIVTDIAWGDLDLEVLVVKDGEEIRIPAMGYHRLLISPNLDDPLAGPYVPSATLDQVIEEKFAGEADRIIPFAAEAVEAAAEAGSFAAATEFDANRAGESAFQSGQSAGYALGHRNAAQASADAAEAAAGEIEEVLANLPPAGADVDAWRKEYFERAFTTPSAIDTPVVTIAAGTTPPESGAVLVREKRIGDETANGVDVAGDTHFRYDGAVTFIRAAGSPTFYVSAGLIPGGAAQSAYYTPRYETLTDPTNKEVAIRIRPPSSTVVFRLTVDGRPVQAEAFRMTGLSAGSGHWIVLKFATARARHIVYEPFGTTGFGGMAVASTQTLTRPTTPLKLRQAFIGDSFLGGTGAPPNGAGRLETYGRIVAQLCDADSIYTLGVGGTGWTTANPFIDRVADVVVAAPQEVFILGSRNDGNVDVSAQVAAVMSGLAGIPSVYVVGPTEKTYPLLEASLKAATEAAGRVYISAREWISGNPAKYLVVGDIHPNMAGQRRIACGIFEGRSAANSI